MNNSAIDQAYMNAEFIWCDYMGIIELPFNSDQIEGIGESGDNEPAVDRCLEQCDVVNAILDSKREQLVSVLREYGAWSDDELQDHETNKQRIVWIAGSDIADNPEDYTQGDEV